MRAKIPDAPGSAADSPATAPAFVEHSRRVLGQLRSALTELWAGVGAGSTGTREIARRLSLDKNLVWKASKIVHAGDLHAMIPHIPGPGGFRILLDSLARHGAPAAAIDRASSAFREYEEMVRVHAGDRDSLALMVSSMTPALPRERLEQARKRAFQGNSVVWGVRADVRLSLTILAPSVSHPDHVDLVQVAGFVGFRRLRPDAHWLVFRREGYSDTGETHPPGGAALDPAAGDGVPFLTEFCSTPIPELVEYESGGEVHYELPGGPVGRTAAQTLVIGLHLREVGAAYRDARERYSELNTNVNTPAETLHADLLVHGDLDWAMDPSVALYSRLDGPVHRSSARDRHLLPMPERTHELGRGLASIATPHVPWYGRMAARVFELLGWDAEAFHGFRLSMQYPPIPSVLMMSAELPERRPDR